MFTSFNQWRVLKKRNTQMYFKILNLKETGFKVCAVIEDDHSANANVVHNVPIL